MKKSLLSLCLLLPLLMGTAAKADEGEMTLRITALALPFPQHPGVNIYLMESVDDDSSISYMWWGIDSNFVEMFATQEPPDPIDTFAVPSKLVKATNLVIGDSWLGEWSGDPVTYEIISEGNYTCGAGTFFAKEAAATLQGQTVPIGSRWFSEGVGLLGWRAEWGFTGQDSLNLMEATIMGGYGYFPLAIGNTWLFHEIWNADTYTAPIANIAIDGHSGDWASLPPAIQDQQGDHVATPYQGTDIKNLYAAVNSSRTTLYLMASFWNGAPGFPESEGFYHFMLNPTTPDSHQCFHVVQSGGQWALSEGNWIPLTNANLGVDSVMEVAMPITNLGSSGMLFNYGLDILQQIGQQYTSIDQTNGIQVNLTGTPVTLPDHNTVLAEFVLFPASPNPFNPSTVASFELRVASLVSLKVYDTAGKLVATLVDGWRNVGRHEVTFDGSGLASGMYLAKLQAGEFTAAQKLVLLK